MSDQLGIVTGLTYFEREGKKLATVDVDYLHPSGSRYSTQFDIDRAETRSHGLNMTVRIPSWAIDTAQCSTGNI